MGITDLYAFVADTPNDPLGETVLAQRIGSAIVPCIAADMARVDALRPHIPAIAAALGTRARLVRWRGPPEILEIIEPEV